VVDRTALLVSAASLDWCLGSFRFGSRRWQRGGCFRECPPPFGLLLYFATASTPLSASTTVFGALTSIPRRAKTLADAGRCGAQRS